MVNDIDQGRITQVAYMARNKKAMQSMTLEWTLGPVDLLLEWILVNFWDIQVWRTKSDIKKITKISFIAFDDVFSILALNTIIINIFQQVFQNILKECMI